MIDHQSPTSVIVSKSLDPRRFPHYLVVKSSADLSRVLQDKTLFFSDFIFHSSTASWEEEIAYLSEDFSRLFTRFIALVSPDNHNPAHALTVTSVGGYTYPDEFFLQDEETLNSFLSSSTDVAVVDPSQADLSVLEGFLDTLKTGSYISPARQTVVVRSAQSLIKRTEQLKMENQEQAKAAVRVMADSIADKKKMVEHSNALSAQLEQIRVAIENGALSSTSSPAPQQTLPSPHTQGTKISVYPPISYSGSRRIFRIKRLGAMKFLLSFTLGLRDFLRDKRNLRPRVLILADEGYRTEALPFPVITNETSALDSAFKDSVIIVTTPLESLMIPLINDDKYNCAIILDMLDSSPRHLVNTHNGRVLYACEGASLPNTLRVPPQQCFTSCGDRPNMAFTVPVFPRYPDNPQSRVAQYATLGQCYSNFLKGSGVSL